MLDLFRFALGAAALIMAIFCAAMAAVVLRVMIDIIRSGPRVADEAYRNGDSIKAWWTGKHPNPSRTSMIGRKSKKYGTVIDHIGS